MALKKTALRAAAIAVMGALALGGCTEGPKYTETAAARAAIPAGKGRIAVYRSQQVQGFGVKPVVLVDGVPTGSCEVNSVFFVDVRPGRHTVVASTTDTSVAVVSVRPGETAYVRCSIEIGPVVGLPKLVLTKQPALESMVFTGQF